MPGGGLVPVGLQRVRGLIIVRAYPHRLDQPNREQLLARHLERRRRAPRPKAEVGLQFLPVVSVAGVEIEMPAPKLKRLDQPDLHVGLERYRLELVIDLVDAILLLEPGLSLEPD